MTKFFSLVQSLNGIRALAELLKLEFSLMKKTHTSKFEIYKYKDLQNCLELLQKYGNFEICKTKGFFSRMAKRKIYLQSKQ